MITDQDTEAARAALDAFLEKFPVIKHNANTAAIAGLAFGAGFFSGAAHERDRPSRADDVLIALCDGTRTLDEIAALTGRTKNAITQRRLKLLKRGAQMPLKIRQATMPHRGQMAHAMHCAGKKYREIAEALGVSTSRARVIVFKFESDWLDADSHLELWADHEARKIRDYGWYSGWRTFYALTWGDHRAHVDEYELHQPFKAEAGVSYVRDDSGELVRAP